MKIKLLTAKRLMLGVCLTTLINNTFSQNSDQISWNKYDFVPGTEIIFEDNLGGEQNGEFPSKWDLVGGNVENANLNAENVLMFIEMGA
ncbi:MAG TPA: hypothetical protein PKJ43_07595, partial [Prolixibacteraceae bacterium]|nr:hypothetical protein [Prolixibacteraceae bacterium]